MIVEKNGKTYKIISQETKFTIKLVSDLKLKIEFNLSKNEYSTFDDVKNYIMENDMF